MLVAVCISIVIGMIIGRLLKPYKEVCPRRVMHHKCKGSACDHRKSVLYTNMASMAKGEEESDSNKNTNLWGG